MWGSTPGWARSQGKRVLVRSDLNVPLDGTRITDDGRIRASVPTIKALADAGARVVVTAHLGRPKGEPEDRYSLQPVAVRLGELLGRDVAFATDTVGDSARETVDGLADGEVALLENVRFNAGETSKDDAERGEFADQLAELADAFVSDGFGVVHRKQASVYDVAQRLPHAMGGLVAAELDVMKRLTEDPERPYVVVLGGSKVSDKLGVIDHLLGKADTLLIGGGMVFTFLKAQGHEVGKSLLEEDQVEVCARVPPAGRGHRRPHRAAHRHRGRHRVPLGRPRPAAAGRPRRRDPVGRARASTSARTRRGRSQRPSRRRTRSSGTGRWASSRPRPSPRAPASSPRP